MSENPDISIELVDADTMVAQADLTSASSITFRPIFNGPGSFSCQFPLASDAARLARKRKTGVLFYRNGEPIWSGGLTSINRSAAAGTCAITAMGWTEELEHRHVWKANEAGLAFGGSGTVGGEIIHALLDAVNSQQDTGGVTRPVRLSFGTASDTQLRIRSYKQGDEVWSKIKELIEIENGCDISIDHLTKKLSTRAPSSYATRADVHWGFGIDPNNLGDVEEVDDGALISNRVSVIAQNGILYAADDSAAINYAGVMLEDWTSLSDVNDPTIALAFANAELVYKRYGNKTYKITPKRYGDLPRPYDDFEWGDAGYLSVDRDSFVVDSQLVRMFAAELRYEDGNEIIGELQVVAS